MDLGTGPGPVMVDAQPEYEVITSSASVELAIKDISLLDLVDGTIVKHGGCPDLS